MKAIRALRFHKRVTAGAQLLRQYCKGCDESKKCSESRAKSVCGGNDKDKEKDEKPKDDAGAEKDCNESKKPKDCGEKKKVTLITGDGVGCELINSLKTVCQCADVPIEWEEVPEIKVAGTEKVSQELIDSLKRNKVGIKGPVESHFWIKDLRKNFELFAYVAVCRHMEGQDSPYGKLNCVIIRDMTEGEYSGIEHSVVPGVLQSIKVSTASGAKRLATYVFKYCKEFDRKKVTVAHKANIMRMTDGNFLKFMRLEAAQNGKQCQFIERYMDTACWNLVLKPEDNDVLVSSSMYGDVLVMMASSITGSQAMCPGYGYSPNGYLFDTLCTVRDDIANKDMINPTGMLFSGVLMLRQLCLNDHAMKISCAIKSVYKDTDCRTEDIGGCAKCSEFTEAVCDKIKNNPQTEC